MQTKNELTCDYFSEIIRGLFPVHSITNVSKYHETHEKTCDTADDANQAGLSARNV